MYGDFQRNVTESRWQEIAYARRKLVVDIKFKFSWLFVVPWLVVKAGEPEMARKCVQQLTSVPPVKLDTLSREYLATLLDSLEAVANGGPVDEKLRREIVRLGNSPLDAGPGEGYHRSTHLTQKRASASRVPHLLASTREKANRKLCKNIIRKYGEKGKRLFRFEWRHYKRILQTTRQKRFTPVHMARDKFYKKLYRLDSDDEDDFQVLMVDDPGNPGKPKRHTLARNL